jgi:hypothetical protein
VSGSNPQLWYQLQRRSPRQAPVAPRLETGSGEKKQGYVGKYVPSTSKPCPTIHRSLVPRRQHVPTRRLGMPATGRARRADALGGSARRLLHSHLSQDRRLANMSG